jgi:hypothetical protein
MDAFPLTNPTSLQNSMLSFLTTPTSGYQAAFYYWDHSLLAWQPLIDSNWLTDGNGSVGAPPNFLGTFNNADFNFRRQNVVSARLALDATTFGVRTLPITSTGTDNSACGAYALESNTTGSANSALGMFSNVSNVTGSHNFGNGYAALPLNLNSNNTAIGSKALERNTSGDDNTSLGKESLIFNQLGILNTAFGDYTCARNSQGDFNTGFGRGALLDLSLAAPGNDGNVAVGYGTFYNTQNNFNTGLGSRTGESNSGLGNVVLGSESMRSSSSSTKNTAVGRFALNTIGASTVNDNNIGIGNDAQVPVATNSNQVRVGNTAITSANVQVAWTITSDRRWKTQIKPTELGSEFLKNLRPVSYIRTNAGSKKTEYGFIAQELQDLLKQYNIKESGIVLTDNSGMLSVRYNDFLSIIIKSIQERQQLIEKRKSQIRRLEKYIENLENKIMLIQK